jgi:hypothetical protein
VSLDPGVPNESLAETECHNGAPKGPELLDAEQFVAWQLFEIAWHFEVTALHFGVIALHFGVIALHFGVIALQLFGLFAWMVSLAIALRVNVWHLLPFVVCFVL